MKSARAIIKKLLVSGFLASSLVAVSPANAAVLLKLIDAQPQSQVPYDFYFTALPTTTIIFGGYQLPSFLQATEITLQDGVSLANVLQPEWLFTPAPVDSLADQTSGFGGYTGANPLEFGGLHVGAYDLFSQSFATNAGNTYHLRFLFTQDWCPGSSGTDCTGTSGFKVVLNESVASVAAQSTPEPATWAMMLTGFGFIGFALRRRGQSGATHSGLA